VNDKTPLVAVTKESLLQATTLLCATDGDLAGVVSRFGPPPLWSRPPTFATMIRIVLEQQVSLSSADAVFRRLRSSVRTMTPACLAQQSVAELRASGLTRQKAEYCRGIALSVASGEIDLRSMARCDDDVVRQTLIGLRGIGPWTADIFLLMALRRPDVWPEGDLALAEATRRIKRLRLRPSRERLRKIASRWAPWRSVAARILWHLYLSEHPRRPRTAKTKRRGSGY